MKIFKQQNIGDSNNLKAIAVSISNKEIIIEADPNYFVVGTKLQIGRSSGPLIQDASPDHIMDQERRTYCFSAFLGILSFKKYNSHFLVMVQDAQKKDGVSGSSSKEVNDYLSQIANILQIGHYFSFNFSISQSLEDQSRFPLKPNLQFIWNYNLMAPLRNNPIVNKKWCIQLIQGFVTQFTTPLKDNQPIQYTLITRRSSFRGGTRYNHRGVDENGNTSNFCESEQILQLGSICCSHRQIRGSVPLFWEQKGFQAILQLTKSEEENKKAFLKHFQKIQQDYSNVMCVNLMSKTKQHEQILTQQFENAIQISSLDFLRYEFFDFHEACKGAFGPPSKLVLAKKIFNYQNVNQLAERLKPITYAFKFFASDNNTNKILFEQSGIIRTNCLDCLDRTNVFMTKIAGSVVEHMMNHMNKDVIKEFDQPILNLIDAPSQNKKMHQFMINFKHAWADNGDHISKHYAGTGATTTKATKQGNIGFMGFLDQSLKGIERFYKGNFEDCYKQECLDIITGKLEAFSNSELTKDTRKETEKMCNNMPNQKQLKIANKQYEQKNVLPNENCSLNVLTITLNAEKVVDLKEQMEENYFIQFERSIPPDMICFSITNIESFDGSQTNTKQSNIWTSLIQRSIMQFGQEYKMISHHYSQGCKIMISTFVLSTLPYQLIHLQTDEVICPNKEDQQVYGCVGVKYQIEQMHFAFLACSLPLGSEENEKRIEYLNEYMQKIFVQKNDTAELQNQNFKDLDVQVLLGNLNFQIALGDQDIQEKVLSYQKLKSLNDVQSMDKINFLLEFDQLKNFQKLDNFLSEFQEGDIQFPPQNRNSVPLVVKNKDEQDSGAQQRFSWYDRICVKKNSPSISLSIQTYELHDEIMGLNLLPISSSVVFNFPKIDKENGNQEQLKTPVEGQKLFFDVQNPPRIFEFFKPPSSNKKIPWQNQSINSKMGGDNNENHSASLDASVTMIMNTNEEDQEECSQSDRYSLLQNILNEQLNVHNTQESDSFTRYSMNSLQSSQKQQPIVQTNAHNHTIPANDQQLSLQSEHREENGKKSEFLNKSNSYNVCFFENQAEEEEGKQCQIPLIKDYIQPKGRICGENQKQEIKYDSTDIKEKFNNYENDNQHQPQIGEIENYEREGRKHRKMSSFDLCTAEDKHQMEGKRILSVIKEESH